MAKYDWKYEKSISKTKQYIDCVDSYTPWLTNKYLCNFIDTVYYSNQMNCNPHLDAKLQYDFLYHSIRKRNRFFKRQKHNKTDDFSLVQQYYKYNTKKTLEVLNTLSEDQLEIIRTKMQKGGVK